MKNGTLHSTNAQRRAWAKDFTRGYRAELENWKAFSSGNPPQPRLRGRRGRGQGTEDFIEGRSGAALHLEPDGRY